MSTKIPSRWIALLKASRIPCFLKNRDELKLLQHLPLRASKATGFSQWKMLSILLFFVLIKALFLTPPQSKIFLESSKAKQTRIWDEKFGKFFPQPEASLLSGILFGTKATMPKEFYNNLQKTGTLHMVAASGYNITVVAGFTMLIAGLISRRIAILLTLFVIFIYSYLAGFEPPIIRASLMGGLTFLAQLLGRKNDALWTLFLVATILLLINPYYLQSVSFQLSFLATFGILYIEPLIRTLFSKLPKILVTDLSVTISAQLITIPIILYHFGTFSLLAPFSNFLLAWIIPITMLLGGFSTLVLILGLPLLDRISSALTLLPLSYFVSIVNITGNLPLASVSFNKKNTLLTLGLYLILLSFIMFLNQKSKRKSVR